jgi:hypothetical protein
MQNCSRRLSGDTLLQLVQRRGQLSADTLREHRVNCRFTLKFRYVAWTRAGIHNACGRVSAMVQAEGTIDAAGRLAFEFNRKGGCARAVMRESVSEVLRVLPGAALAEAAPDYVGLSNLGRILGISRQCARKWVMRRGSEFPAAVHEVNGAVWHLADVLLWARAVGRLRVEPELLEIARCAAELNLRVEASRLRRIRRQLRDRPPDRSPCQSKANPEIIVPSTISE